jgi:hypothetical protein
MNFVQIEVIFGRNHELVINLQALFRRLIIIIYLTLFGAAYF